MDCSTPVIECHAEGNRIRHDGTAPAGTVLIREVPRTMDDPRRRLRSSYWARLALPAVMVAIAGCGGGQEVTHESVQAARQLWTHAGIRDYDLDWSVTGSNNARYHVTVRNGEVHQIQAIRPDGTLGTLHSGKPEMFGIDGLFRTMDEELAVCAKSERPFGQPKGTRVVMRFLPDARLGYPHWYHRDVLGSPMSMAIEVNALTHAPRAPTPP